MPVVNIHEAKTHLSRLIEKVEAGEAVTIARAGKPVVKLVPVDTSPARKKRRLGFLAGQFTVPEDFDRMGEAEIQAMFEGKP